MMVALIRCDFLLSLRFVAGCVYRGNDQAADRSHSSSVNGRSEMM